MSRWHSLTPTQCRAARAGLGISADDLGEAAGVAARTVLRLEGGTPIFCKNAAALRAYFEARGVKFTEETISDRGAPRVLVGVCFQDN